MLPCRYSALSIDFEFGMLVDVVNVVDGATTDVDDSNRDEGGEGGGSAANLNLEERYSRVAESIRDAVTSCKEHSGIVFCGWSAPSGGQNVYLKLVFANADALVQFSKVLKQLFLEFRGSFVSRISASESSKEVQHKGANADLLKLRKVALQTVEAQRSRLVEACKAFGPTVVGASHVVFRET